MTPPDTRGSRAPCDARPPWDCWWGAGCSVWRPRPRPRRARAGTRRLRPRPAPPSVLPRRCSWARRLRPRPPPATTSTGSSPGRGSTPHRPGFGHAARRGRPARFLHLAARRLRRSAPPPALHVRHADRYGGQGRRHRRALLHPAPGPLGRRPVEQRPAAGGLLHPAHGHGPRAGGPRSAGTGPPASRGQGRRRGLRGRQRAGHAARPRLRNGLRHSAGRRLVRRLVVRPLALDGGRRAARRARRHRGLPPDPGRGPSRTGVPPTG